VNRLHIILAQIVLKLFWKLRWLHRLSVSFLRRFDVLSSAVFLLILSLLSPVICSNFM